MNEAQEGFGLLMLTAQFSTLVPVTSIETLKLIRQNRITFGQKFCLGKKQLKREGTVRLFQTPVSLGLIVEKL